LAHSSNRIKAGRHVDLWPSARVTTAFFTSDWTPASFEHFPFAFTDERVDALDLDVEKSLDRSLDLPLGRGFPDLEIT